MTPIEGILLAAGESRRMGYPKPLLRLNSHTYIESAALGMLDSVARLIIVVGAHAERVRAAIPHDSRVSVVENPQWRSGQLSSLQVGLAAIARDATAAMVHLVDHPTVLRTTYLTLANEFAKSHSQVLIARHRGRRGHPAIFARAIFDELALAPVDRGARAVIDADPSRVAYLDVDDPGVSLDLDTPADLARAGLPPPPPT
ncbi:MAG: nucleotidyltransferase family protein [Candidatus Binataceae bacterium]